jgi:hypothetical protein
MASLARGYSGFGFSAVLVASWSLVGSPALAVVVALVLEVTASIIQAASVWQDIPWRRVGLLMAGAIVVTPLGVHLLAATDERTLRIGIAIFILLAAVALLAGLRLPTRARLPLVLSVGVAPHLIVGLGIAAMNADAAREVWNAAQYEHREASA